MKLLAAISHHGLGHLAQAGPVLNALREIRPDLDLTVWSGLPRAALERRLCFAFSHRAEAADVGLLMADAIKVDVAASVAAYRDFHRDWADRIEREALWLRSAGFQWVFSDVAHLPLAAARHAGLPAIALCSLNWRDIAAAYLEGVEGMDVTLQQIEMAYRGADIFLRPLPSMPMAWLDNTESVAPIAALGVNRRSELAERFGIGRDSKAVLVGFGGIGYHAALPKIPGVTWVAPDDWDDGRPDLIRFGDTCMPFLDLLASSDGMLTKVGYGSFVEALAHAVPVVYIDRPDWPETPFLADWLTREGRGLSMGEADLQSGRLAEILDRLWRMPAKPAVLADGAEIVARRMLELLD